MSHVISTARPIEYTDVPKWFRCNWLNKGRAYVSHNEYQISTYDKSNLTWMNSVVDYANKILSSKVNYKVNVSVLCERSLAWGHRESKFHVQYLAQNGTVRSETAFSYTENLIPLSVVLDSHFSKFDCAITFLKGIGRI